MADTGSLVQRTHSRVADEEQGLRTGSTTFGSPEPKRGHLKLGDSGRVYHMADRFLRRGKRKIGVVESLKALVLSSLLNVLLIFIPIAWAAHFLDWSPQATFVLCFLAIIPLEKLFDYGGEQMTFYLGSDLGDLLVITLNNAVEATLAILLLTKCSLKLLQSTLIGVVLLHLLLIPGVAFVTGGARVLEQDLHPHLVQLNHTLLTIGVMTLLLPAAFFAALDGGSIAADTGEQFVSDTTRGIFLQMSRGLALILLAVYVCSRIFLHNPPGEGNSELAQHKLAPEAMRDRALEIDNQDPEISQWVCLGMLCVTIGIMAATAEWLVDSVELLRKGSTINIKEEWFGLILLPLVSFSGDAFVAIIFFFRSSYRYMRGQRPPPVTLAKARAIDLSIQFTLFWMPFIVLLGWWTGRPMSLLFDVFEVALVISSCFIVNYVTADSKTNWAEGFAMLAFYVMIALCSWFYSGQEEIELLLACPMSVSEALVAGVEAIAE